jgi:hypothetical protein
MSSLPGLMEDPREAPRAIPREKFSSQNTSLARRSPWEQLLQNAKSRLLSLLYALLPCPSSTSPISISLRRLHAKGSLEGRPRQPL